MQNVKCYNKESVRGNIECYIIGKRRLKMFQLKSKQGKKEIEELFHEIQINLENNYKDLAIGARKKAKLRLEELYGDDRLSEKDYKKLKSTLDDFTRRMEGYHH